MNKRSPRNPDFVGREEELEDLLTLLVADEPVVLTQGFCCVGAVASIFSEMSTPTTDPPGCDRAKPRWLACQSHTRCPARGDPGRCRKIEQLFPIRPIAPPGEDQQQHIVEKGKTDATICFRDARGSRRGLGGALDLKVAGSNPAPDLTQVPCIISCVMLPMMQLTVEEQSAAPVNASVALVARRAEGIR